MRHLFIWSLTSLPDQVAQALILTLNMKFQSKDSDLYIYYKAICISKLCRIHLSREDPSKMKNCYMKESLQEPLILKKWEIPIQKFPRHIEMKLPNWSFGHKCSYLYLASRQRWPSRLLYNHAYNDVGSKTATSHDPDTWPHPWGYRLRYNAQIHWCMHYHQWRTAHPWGISYTKINLQSQKKNPKKLILQL